MLGGPIFWATSFEGVVCFGTRALTYSLYEL